MDLSSGQYRRENDNPRSTRDQASTLAVALHNDFYALAQLFSVSADVCRDPDDRARIGRCHALAMQGLELASSLNGAVGRN
jgi:hypothetical protein